MQKKDYVIVFFSEFNIMQIHSPLLQIQVCLTELYHKQIRISTAKNNSAPDHCIHDQVRRYYAERDSLPMCQRHIVRKHRRRDRRCPTAHRAVGFYCSSPFLCICKKADTRMGICFFGTPKGTRTPDLLIRSQSLYPTELSAHTHSQVPKYNNMGVQKSQALFSKYFKIFISLSAKSIRLDRVCLLL